MNTLVILKLTVFGIPSLRLFMPNNPDRFVTQSCVWTFICIHMI